MKWHHVLSDEIIQNHLWSGLAKKKKLDMILPLDPTTYLQDIEDRGTC